VSIDQHYYCSDNWFKNISFFVQWYVNMFTAYESDEYLAVPKLDHSWISRKSIVKTSQIRKLGCWVSPWGICQGMEHLGWKSGHPANTGMGGSSWTVSSQYAANSDHLQCCPVWSALTTKSFLKWGIKVVLDKKWKPGVMERCVITNNAHSRQFDVSLSALQQGAKMISVL
jgi:hypothetical protein